MSTGKISRRKLIKNTVIAGIGTTFFFNPALKAFGRSGNSLSKVVLIRDNAVLNEELVPDKILLEQMLDKALVELTSGPDSEKAWKKILKPNDVLGIKTNVWDNLHTPAELEEILKSKAIGVGIGLNDISINDRGVLKDPVFQRANALINVRPMRSHAWSGVGSLIKNYIMFAETPSKYHPDSCADLAAVWSLPNVKDKTRLNILVMLTPLFHGIGPHHYNKQYIWNYSGLLVGFDPVAVDSVGLRIIEAKRKEYFGEESPLNPPAKHIAISDTRHHLGTSDPNKIDLVRLGWKENILI
jgi:hypothetical protein